MKSLAFLALSAVATAAMAASATDPNQLTISGTSTQTASVSGGFVTNTANSYSYANQNIASNKGGVNIDGTSTQASTLTNSLVTNEAKHEGDVAVQNLASNVGNVTVGSDGNSSKMGHNPGGGNGPSVKGVSTQTANVTGSTVMNVANGDSGCRGFNCEDAALAYQNLASNMGTITINGVSEQTVGVSGNSTVKNLADGPQTVAVQNLSSNYGDVTISGKSTQTTWVASNAFVGNFALGRAAHAYQNLASNDSCDPPPPVCVGPACGPYSR